MEWKHAAYFGKKSGGGKLKSVATEGDRGIPKAGKYPGKSKIGKGGIDSPGMKGDMGIPSTKGVKGKSSQWAAKHD